MRVLTGVGKAVGEMGSSSRRMCEQCDGGDSDGVTGEVVGAAPFGLSGPGLAKMSAVTATSEVLLLLVPVSS